MNNNKTYGELALNHSLSTSLVKKEMRKILDYFGCRNMESLKIVFSQFDIVVE
jgi:DNA-binding CsgD family transcriptional regulator